MEVVMSKTRALTEAKLRALKPQKRRYQVFDGNGLYIEVNTNGSKLWRIQKVIDGKLVRRSFGKYPAIDLKTARERRAAFEKRQATGVCHTISSLVSFGDLFNEWKAKHTVNHSLSTLSALKIYSYNHLLPQLGHVKLEFISPQLILNKVLRPIEAKNLSATAFRIKGLCSQVLRYGVALGVVERDFTQDLKGALAPAKVHNLPSITDPPKVGKLMRNIFSYKGIISVVYALRILPYVFVRPGELRMALWEEVNFEDKIWRIPAEKMKMRRTHLVPLANQVVAMLTELRQLTGHSRFLFPGTRVKNKPINKMALLVALRNMGYAKDEIVPHGFRTMASTLLNEMGYSPDWIEKQLAHVSGGVRAIYNRSEYLAERRKMMQDWADYLDKLRQV
jgi:integrase